jgi:hypothetical protein
MNPNASNEYNICKGRYRPSFNRFGDFFLLTAQEMDQFA